MGISALHINSEQNPEEKKEALKRSLAICRTSRHIDHLRMHMQYIRFVGTKAKTFQIEVDSEFQIDDTAKM